MIDINLTVSQIETPRGRVEFAVAGSGLPILYFHGTPCGSRLVVDMEHDLIAAGYQLIIPHRPGYYGTPLSDCRTTTDCAQLAAHVLDHLSIKQVAVIGTSGGGPPALAFAIRYPDRTAGLILQCAQTHRWDDGRWGPSSQPLIWHCFRARMPRWLFCRFFATLFRIGFPSAEPYLRDLTGKRFPEIRNEPAALQLAESVCNSMAEFHLERAGLYNDASTWVRENVLSTGQVRSPTLLLYDREDPQAPFCHAEFAAKNIPGAKMVELNAGGHLIWFGRDAGRMQEERTKFLTNCLTATSQL